MDDRDALFCSSPEQGAERGLLALMTGISEGYYCAAWIQGLDRQLWRIAFEDADPKYGMGVVTTRQRELLRLLAEEADGWWAWSADVTNGPIWTPLHDWRASLRAD